MKVNCKSAMVMESSRRRNDGTSFSRHLRSYAVDFARPCIAGAAAEGPMNARIAPAADISVDPDAIARSARTVIATEAAAIRALEPRVNADFVEACRLILGCKGRLVVSGMGKSGHIGRKIAATLASTGTPA
jgi:arabinose-5-phosphate isomerase